MEISVLSRKILRELCTNSRVSISDLVNKYNVDWHIIKNRITAIEKEFGLFYTLELNSTALGITTLHVVIINFVKKPSFEEFKKFAEGSQNVQLAFTTKGDFDAVLFAIAATPKAYYMWEISLMMELAKYGVSIRSSEATMPHIGFVPLNDEQIRKSDIDAVYKKMLLVLNSDSRTTVRELSKRIGMKENITRYYLGKLEKSNIIRRYTALITKPPYKFNILYFTNYTVRLGIDRRVGNERRLQYWRKTDNFPVINEFQMMFGMCGGENSLNWAIYENLEEGLKQSVELHRKIYDADSPEVKWALIDKVAKGVLPLRNIDMKDGFDFAFSESTTPGITAKTD